jgi:hypothetical protein
MDAVIPYSITAVLELHNPNPFRPLQLHLPFALATSVMLVPQDECHFLVDNTGLLNA